MNIDRTSAARPQVTPPTTPVDATLSSAPPVAPERAAAEAHPDRVGDRIELSPEAREITAEPDAARAAAVAALRAQLDAGTYQVDADGVARRIVARGDI